jgi:hypothetical protein
MQTHRGAWGYGYSNHWEIPLRGLSTGKVFTSANLMLSILRLPVALYQIWIMTFLIWLSCMISLEQLPNKLAIGFSKKSTIDQDLIKIIV